MFTLSEAASEIDRTGYACICIGALASYFILLGVHNWSSLDRSIRKNADERVVEMAEYNMSPRSSPGTDAEVKQDAPKPNRRYCFIDCARGLTVTFVTFFHLIWNLRHNGLLPIEPRIRGHELFVEICEFWVFFGVCFLILSEVFQKSVFAGYAGFMTVVAFCIIWHYWAAQMSGVGIIMFCVGMSSYVQNCEVVKWNKVISRIKKLFLVSLSITIVTYILLPDEFVYFGAIHCITAVSILHLPFLRYPQFAILGALFIFLYKGFLGDFPLEVTVFRDTVDHMPWFENLGYLLFGVFCGYAGVHKSSHYVRCLWGRFAKGVHLEDSIFPLLGRYSLWIFLAHQVVLFPLIKLISAAILE